MICSGTFQQDWMLANMTPVGKILEKPCDTLRSMLAKRHPSFTNLQISSYIKISLLNFVVHVTLSKSDDIQIVSVEYKAQLQTIPFISGTSVREPLMYL